MAVPADMMLEVWPELGYKGSVCVEGGYTLEPYILSSQLIPNNTKIANG